METITATGSAVDGHLQVDLGKTCNCLVGLVEITFPPLSIADDYARQIDVCCSEIDRTFTNPNRILRRVFINKTRFDVKFYRTVHFQHILYQKIDSFGRFLNIYLYDEIGQPIKLPYNNYDEKITLVLSFIPKSDDQCLF